MFNPKVMLLCVVGLALTGCESRPKMSHSEKMETLARMTGQSVEQVERSISDGEAEKRERKRREREEQRAIQEAQALERERMEDEVAYQVLKAKEYSLVLPSAPTSKSTGTSAESEQKIYSEGLDCWGRTVQERQNQPRGTVCPE